MQMNPFSTDKFKKLRAEWDLKLEQSGFKDIEDGDEEFTDHKSLCDLNQRIHFKAGIKELTESYWDWACAALYHSAFKSPRDKRIWELHTQGFSCTKISIEVGLERSWCTRKILRITKYLKAQDYPVRSVLPYILSK